MIWQECCRKAAGQLEAAGIENAQAESWFLMEASCEIDRNFYYLHGTEEMPQQQEQKFHEWVDARCRRIPLQHLTGEQEFMGLPFSVTPDVLIPRQDTEVLVELVLDKLKKQLNNRPDLPELSQVQNAKNPKPGKTKTFNYHVDASDSDKREVSEQNTESFKPDKTKAFEPEIRVLDMCTGSGCIAVSLKAYLPQIEVTAADISENALAVAKKNAEKNKQDITFVKTDLFENINETYDMIVSNPPYIASAEIPGLMPEVREHEPVLALDGKEDGLFFYRNIVKDSVKYLVSGGILAFEIGWDQGAAVSEMMRVQGYTDVRVVRDLAGLDRVVIGRRE